MLYNDQTSSAESVIAQLGAFKAGVQIVTFEEKDSADALEHALHSTKAKGLLFNPEAATESKQTRMSFVHGLMPELNKMYFGDALSVAKFPHLEHLVQTKFSAIRGVSSFRDMSVYATPQYSSHEIPQNQADDVVRVALKDGRATEYSSGDLVSHADNLWNDHFSKAANDVNPIFMACDLESPMGLAAMLGCATNFKKVFVPGTYNMSSLLKSIPLQGSNFLVCDGDFYSLEAPAGSDYPEMCSGIKHVVVAGNKGSSSLFSNASASAIDPIL